MLRATLRYDSDKWFWHWQHKNGHTHTQKQRLHKTDHHMGLRAYGFKGFIVSMFAQLGYIVCMLITCAAIQ